MRIEAAFEVITHLINSSGLPLVEPVTGNALTGAQARFRCGDVDVSLFVEIRLEHGLPALNMDIQGTGGFLSIAQAQTLNDLHGCVLDLAGRIYVYIESIRLMSCQ